MGFFLNLFSFFKNRGDKAAVGTFQRHRVVSVSGDVTPDGRKSEAQVWNFISLNPVSVSFFKVGIYVVTSV